MFGRVFRVGTLAPLLVAFIILAVASSAVPATRAAPVPTPSKDKFGIVDPTGPVKNAANPVEEAAWNTQIWIDQHGWSGFGHIAVDSANDTVNIVGTTAPPTALLGDLKDQYPSISFVYVKSAYTSAELLAAAAKISDRFLTGPYALSMVGADSNDNGLVVAPVDQSLLDPAKALTLVAAIGAAYPVSVVAGYGEGHLT